MRTIGLLWVAVISACGARTGLDVVRDAGHPDATIHDAGNEDVLSLPDVVQVECPTSGYFIDLGNGTVLRDGCEGGVPSHFCEVCGDSCFGDGILGCKVSDDLKLGLYAPLLVCEPLPVGTNGVQAFLLSDAGFELGNGTMTITGISATAAVGSYDAILRGFDGGPVHLSGAFCVHP